MIPILILIAAVSVAALLWLWCYITRQELRQKTDMVNSAKSQLKACSQTLQALSDESQIAQARAVAERCWDIYLQAVTLYNDTLRRPVYRFPAALLHYRPIKLK